MIIVDDMALVEMIDEKDVTKELMKCDGSKTVVFHTSRDRIEIEVAKLRAGLYLA